MQKNAKKIQKIEMQIVVNEKARHSQLTINREQ